MNSFGFGGSNSHAVLDDACHYLRSRSLKANHHTVDKPPRVKTQGSQYLTNGTGATRSSSETNGEVSNGIKLNGVNGHIHTNSKLTNENTHNHDSEVPKLLTWSAADEGGIDRLMDIWQAHFADTAAVGIPDDKAYLEQLSHILGFQRSSLPWKSYALVNSASDITKVKGRISRPVRSSKLLGVGFIFTGQGAQYNQMGTALFGYPVFRKSLEAFDRELMKLGCSWSIVGMPYLKLICFCRYDHGR